MIDLASSMHVSFKTCEFCISGDVSFAHWDEDACSFWLSATAFGNVVLLSVDFNEKFESLDAFDDDEWSDEHDEDPDNAVASKCDIKS